MKDEQTAQQFPVTLAVRVSGNGSTVYYARRVTFPWNPCKEDQIEIDPLGNASVWVFSVGWRVMMDGANPEYVVRLEIGRPESTEEQINLLTSLGYERLSK